MTTKNNKTKTSKTKTSTSRGKHWSHDKMAWCKTGGDSVIKLSDVTKKVYPAGNDKLLMSQFFNAYKRIISWPVVDSKGRITEPRRIDNRYRYISFLAKDLSMMGWEAAQVKAFWSGCKQVFKKTMGGQFVDLGDKPPTFVRKAKTSKKTIEEELLGLVETLKSQDVTDGQHTITEAIKKVKKGKK